MRHHRQNRLNIILNRPLHLTNNPFNTNMPLSPPNNHNHPTQTQLHHLLPNYNQVHSKESGNALLFSPSKQKKTPKSSTNEHVTSPEITNPSSHFRASVQNSTKKQLINTSTFATFPKKLNKLQSKLIEQKKVANVVKTVDPNTLVDLHFSHISTDQSLTCYVNKVLTISQQNISTRINSHDPEYSNP